MTHVYVPAMRKGMSKMQAGFICFFISAIFHEVRIFSEISVQYLSARAKLDALNLL